MAKDNECQFAYGESTACPHGACDEPERAAKKAVKECFAIMGVDIDKPEQVEEFRENLRFSGYSRRLTNRGVSAVFICVLLIVTTGTCALIWKSIVNNLPVPGVNR